MSRKDLQHSITFYARFALYAYSSTLQTSWANNGYLSFNQLENHSGFQLIGEHESHCFPNTSGKWTAFCPQINLKTILFSNCLANGKIICSQNGQLLQPFRKLQHTLICSQLERLNLAGSAGDCLEALYTVLHPVGLQNCVESQCGRGYKLNLIVSAWTIVMVDLWAGSTSCCGHRVFVWGSNPAWDKFFVLDCCQPGAALPMQRCSVVGFRVSLPVASLA
jgi:hypothetical protein